MLPLEPPRPSGEDPVGNGELRSGPDRRIGLPVADRRCKVKTRGSAPGTFRPSVSRRATGAQRARSAGTSVRFRGPARWPGRPKFPGAAPHCKNPAPLVTCGGVIAVMDRTHRTATTLTAPGKQRSATGWRRRPPRISGALNPRPASFHLRTAAPRVRGSSAASGGSVCLMPFRVGAGSASQSPKIQPHKRDGTLRAAARPPGIPAGGEKHHGPHEKIGANRLHPDPESLPATRLPATPESPAWRQPRRNSDRIVHGWVADGHSSAKTRVRCLLGACARSVRSLSRCCSRVAAQQAIVRCRSGLRPPGKSVATRIFRPRERGRPRRGAGVGHFGDLGNGQELVGKFPMEVPQELAGAVARCRSRGSPPARVRHKRPPVGPNSSSRIASAEYSRDARSPLRWRREPAARCDRMLPT